MIEFFNKLFGRQASGATAKERLRLVLMSDHLSLAPEMVESMKRDLVDVISRYVEVDREKIDIHFEHEDKALAMLANIPITGVNRTGSSDGDATKQQSKAALANPDSASHGVAIEPPPSGGEAPAEPTQPSRAPRRKRRKSTNGTSQPAAGTA